MRIDDGPAGIVLQPLSNVTRHGADLQMELRTATSSSRVYEVHRKLGSGVLQITTSWWRRSPIRYLPTCSDSYSVLEPNYYYYCVYAVDTQGMYSCPSNEGMAQYPAMLPAMSYPAFDDLEGGTANWDWGLPWGTTTTAAHSGTTSWTDSPGSTCRTA